MPPTRAPRCGALVVVVAAPEHSVPRLRRGRVPASATASGVRVVDVPASREPRLRRRSRALAPRAVCPRPSSGARGACAPRAVCSSSECRAPAERAAPEPAEPRRPRARVECVAPSPSERRGGRACDERAVCSCRACRGWPWPCARVERAGVLASREPCSRPACRARRPSAVCSRRGSGRRVPATRERPRLRRECRRPDAVVCSCRASRRARRPCAALWRPRRECRRARARSAAAVCLRRGSRRASDDRAAARALAPSAAVPSTRERYAGAVGAVSEWWTCLRRACRTDR